MAAVTAVAAVAAVTGSYSSASFSSNRRTELKTYFSPLQVKASHQQEYIEPARRGEGGGGKLLETFQRRGIVVIYLGNGRRGGERKKMGLMWISPMDSTVDTDWRLLVDCIPSSG